MGILGLQGTVGGLVFRKDGSVAQKPASNKTAFTNSANLARTRENASEFGTAASATKLLRDSLRVAIQAASDKRIVSRLTKAMRAILALDTTNDRGSAKCSRPIWLRCWVSTSTWARALGRTCSSSTRLRAAART